MKTALNKKYILVICLLSFITFSSCKKGTPTPRQPQQPQAQHKQLPAAEPTATKTEQPPKPQLNISKSLMDIIERRTSWDPIMINLYGQQMPDFEVTDIAGKSHRLSQYHGKNVLIVMWATWCQPCMHEVPELITLREIMSEDKLAILAISNEDSATVAKTVQAKKMNYTVIAAKQNLPKPFSDVDGIPTAFYIKPNGTLKLVTQGVARLGEMKAIIIAE